MLIADIRHHVSTDFVIFSEFVALCGSNFQASNLLSNLFWWSEVAEKNPKRCGWIYKTASDLNEEVGLTRRGYEKARKFLSKKGIIQYKRAGVFGKMHWQINKEKLLELVYQVKGQPVPEFDSKYQFDTDNFRLERWVNLTLWNAFLKMRTEKTGKAPTIKQKKYLLNQLKDLKNKKLDLNAIMEKSIASGWAGFYVPESRNTPPTAVPADVSVSKIAAEIQAQLDERNQPPPQSELTPEERRQRLETLKKNMKK